MVGITSTGVVEVLLPIALSALLTLIRIVIRWSLDTASFKRTNSARGHQIFRASFIAPDMLLLALALVGSSEAIKSVLAGHDIQSFFGERFYFYFWFLVLSIFLLLFFWLFLWNVSEDNELALEVIRVDEVRRSRAGQEQPVQVWDINWASSLATRSGKLFLVVGNLTGVISIIMYTCLIYFGFVTRF